MIAAVKQFVQSVIVIMLLASFLQIILPEGGMKRYAQLALGLTMVLTLLTPLLTLSRAPLGVGVLLSQAKVETAWQELQQQSAIWRQQNDELLLANYRLELTAQIKQLVEASGEMSLVDCRLLLVTDRNLPDFGRIRQVAVDLSQNTEQVLPVSRVLPVKVGGPPLQADDPPSAVAAGKAATIRDALAKHFVLTTDRVAVTIK